MELAVPNLGLKGIDSDRCLHNPISQRMPHGGACLERAEHGHRRDRRPRQCGSHVIGYPRETDNLYMQHVPCGSGALKVAARVVLQSQNQRAARQRLFQRIGMQRQLVTNARANQVGSV